MPRLPHPGRKECDQPQSLHSPGGPPSQPDTHKEEPKREGHQPSQPPCSRRRSRNCGQNWLLQEGH
eukprot:7504636-Pyramimonas_sp.AAC.1